MIPNIILTEKSIKAINNHLEKNNNIKYLRVGCKGSGCSGYTTVFQFEENKKDTDIVLNINGAAVIIDPKSMKMLDGSTLDYRHSLVKSGFTLDIPNAKYCGCQKSFSTK
jgi:iron-sulfur cluster assembly protein